MIVSAVTAEYNPFHNGHKFHMEETRKQTGCDYLIAVMSGDFTQRGEAAVFNKYIRAKAALMAGFDLVLELPTVYATSSADRFALGSLSLLNRLNCIDYISFGSESTDIDNLYNICNYQMSETYAESQTFKSELKKGESYRSASKYGNTPLRSNDILGVSYLKALTTLGSDIKPILVKREGGDYFNDESCSLSAMSIRRTLAECGNLNNCADKITCDILSYYSDVLSSVNPVCNNDLSSCVYQALLSNISSGVDLTQFYDVSETISGKIQSKLCDFSSFDEFTELLLSKDVIASRIRRALIHILLGIKDEDIQLYDNAGYTGYARILGFRESSKELLGYVNKNTDIPLIAKSADARKFLNDTSYKMFNTDLTAADLYEHSICKTVHKIKPDIAISPIILS